MDQEISEQNPRERILQASLVLFVNQGYFNTNIPDISRESHCSVGSIYHYFLNKEEIASHLYSNGIRQFRNALSEEVDFSMNLEVVVSQIVTGFLNFAEKDKLISKYLWLSRHGEFVGKRVFPPTKVGFDCLGRKLTKVLRDGIRRQEIRPLRAEIIWSILFGIPLGFIRDWLDGYTIQSPTQASGEIARACWAALRKDDRF